MDFAVALTLAQTLLQLLDSSSPLWGKIESAWGYKSQLKKLENTLRLIQAVLVEAEQRQRQQHGVSLPLQESLGRLNEVLYDASDLFDEVATLAQRKSLMSGNIVSKEVRQFFSRFNQLKYALTKSNEIKNIRKILDDIAKDYTQFGSMVPQQGGGRISENNSNPRETSSLLCKDDVIVGRGQDKRGLIEMLLDTTVGESASCVSIVGIGGLGKTTLAQVVYNDDEIVREFGLRMWVCVSNDFDVIAVLGAILAAATNQPRQGGLSMDKLHRDIREKLDGKKYLLVLDDVWDDIANKWDEIRKPLIEGGSRGSRILVTTRSANMADIVGGQTHELKGLSLVESWNLFERMTLKSRHEMEALNGENILKKCAGVPLAIRVVGSYLRHQSERKWMHMGNTTFATVGNKDIMSVLMISYYDLPLHLKRCFSYCAIFPKDYEIIKDDLIYLWIAQDFIKPNEWSLEDVANEYFMKLLARCFFQDVSRGDDGEIISCKMHDLIHDIATDRAGTEMMLVKHRSDLKENARHVIIGYEVLKRKEYIRVCTRNKRMRSLLKNLNPFLPSVNLNSVDISKARNLRTLSWPVYDMKKEANLIGELMHLRYLDLSFSFFSALPSSVTNLFNLQTLKLRGCHNLAKLPEDLSKLVNLRCLDLFGCSSLQHMPPGMRSMTCIHKLPWFVLDSSEGDRVSGVEDLKCLTSLTGTLVINIRHWINVAKVEERDLSNLEHLKGIEFKFDCWNDDTEEALLEVLKPNHNLQTMKLFGCFNKRFPSWGMMGGSSTNIKSVLPNLVELYIEKCTQMEHLPLMSQLPKLRVLHLKTLYALKEVESSHGDGASMELGSPRHGELDKLVFFPSLQILELENLLQLKGWGSHSDLYAFPRLKTLSIKDCHKLRSFPLCRDGLEDFYISFSCYLGCLSFTDKSGGLVMINSINCKYIINSMPSNILHHLPCLEIEYTDDVEGLLTETREVFDTGRVPSLLSLEIQECKKLRMLLELRAMWKHLTSLETLKLNNLPELDLNMPFPWVILTRTLRHLTLEKLPKLYKLPRGMQCLTYLLSLEISYCENLEELPHIGCFKYLHSLVLHDCRKLKTLPQEMCHLTNLDTLELSVLPELELKREEASDMPWIAPTLQNLTLACLPQLLSLPTGMNHLISLHSLKISFCPLEELPEWIGNFTSLTTLKISFCKQLKRLPQEICLLTGLQNLEIHAQPKEFKQRCRKPNGADWPNIQHIPNIYVYGTS